GVAAFVALVRRALEVAAALHNGVGAGGQVGRTAQQHGQLGADGLQHVAAGLAGGHGLGAFKGGHGVGPAFGQLLGEPVLVLLGQVGVGLGVGVELGVPVGLGLAAGGLGGFAQRGHFVRDVEILVRVPAQVLLGGLDLVAAQL